MQARSKARSSPLTSFAACNEGRITPTEAVNVVAAHVEKQGREEMVMAGTPQEDILSRFQGLRETVSERLAPYPGPGH
jgi:hypothetical protein